MLELLAQHGDSTESLIPVAIETPRGLLVACFRDTGRKIYAINPLAAALYRDRGSVARAESDAADARTPAGADVHDSQALVPLVQGIPPVRSRRGPRRRRPAKLHADKGYDYAHLRPWLSARGIRHRIAREGMDSPQRLGRPRWVAERTISWLAGCRRLHRRYERKPEHSLAFTSIACTLICLRHLTR